MKTYNCLDKINMPDDVKKLSDKEMLLLAQDIRNFLIEKVKKNGGHLSSNLGVVELTLALHKVFNAPKDHIIWDVGHQSYVHKIITGRKDSFDTLRKPGGLSGFTKRAESEYDCFGAGHSSTSLSAALGFAYSDKLKGSDAYTIAVIGDGAFTGGMIHEALNNSKMDMRLIIVLNENEMSISKNIGGFAKYIARIRSSKKYYKVKDKTVSFINNLPVVGKKTFEVMRDAKQAIKNLMYDSNYFEELGLYYIGPVDGNDYEAVRDLLEVAKDLKRSTIVHVTTKKGKGYKPAESDPGSYHGISPEGSMKSSDNFSKAFGKILTKKAVDCKDICAITAAMPVNTGLDIFKKAHPERFFDVGIAEEHAVTFCAGLAANGMRPCFAVYSTFLQRGYDNILHDVALQKLPVMFFIDRAGLSKGDGPTHHGIYDVAYISHIPNMEIYTPVTFDGLRRTVDLAYERNMPCAIRYSNTCENKDIVREFYSDNSDLTIGVKSNFKDKNSNKCVIITYGSIVSEAMIACETLRNTGVQCGIILLEMLKPYDNICNEIEQMLPDKKANIIFLEEGVECGGASMIISQKLRNLQVMKNKKVTIRAIKDKFYCGKPGEDLYHTCGISADDIVKAYYEGENNL